MYKKYLPHHWLNLKRLAIAWIVFFYATLIFGIYAAYNWILVLQLPEEFWQQNSAPLIRIYGFGAGGALLAAATEMGILYVLKTLRKIKKAVTKN